MKLIFNTYIIRDIICFSRRVKLTLSLLEVLSIAQKDEIGDGFNTHTLNSSIKDTCISEFKVLYLVYTTE